MKKQKGAEYEELVRNAKQGVINYAKHIKCTKKTIEQISNELGKLDVKIVPSDYVAKVSDEVCLVIDMHNKLGMNLVELSKYDNQNVELKKCSFVVRFTEKEMLESTGIIFSEMEIEKYITRTLLHEIIYVLGCNASICFNDVIVQRAGLLKTYYLDNEEKLIAYDLNLNEVLIDYFAYQIYSYMYNTTSIVYEYTAKYGRVVVLGTKYAKAIPIFTMLNIVMQNKENAHVLFEAYINNDKKKIAKELYVNTGLNYMQVVNCCNTLVKDFQEGRSLVDKMFESLLDKIMKLNLSDKKREKIKETLQHNFEILENREYYHIYRKFARAK